MAMNLKERLAHARISSGYDEPAEAARKAGISPSALYQLEDGTTKSLRGTTAVQLGRVYTSFRVEWLIDGSGPQTHSAVQEPTGSYVIATGETPAGYKRLRVMEGDASGGNGAVNDDYPEVLREIDVAEWQLRKQIGFVPTEDRVRLVTVRGDSMYPDIKHGDVVMVDTARAFYDGDGLYLINIHDHTFIKRLQMLTDGLHILSTNPKFLGQLIPPSETDTVHIGGRIVGLALMRRAEEV